MEKIIAILLLFSVSVNADYIVLKLGTRGLNNGNLEWDWRTGQIVDILPDGTPFSDHMKQHFLILKVKPLTAEMKYQLLESSYSAVVTEGERVLRGGELIARRKFHIPIESLPGMTNKKIQNLLEKKTVNGIVDLTGYNIDNYLKNSFTNPIQTSQYDLGGSISSGSFTIGTSQDYATVSAFEADLAANLIDAVTGQVNASYNDTTAVTFGGTQSFSTAAIILDVSSANRHAGKWDATKFRMTSDGVAAMVTITNKYMIIRNFQINMSNTDATTSAFVGINCTTNNLNEVFDSCIIIGGRNGIKGAVDGSTYTVVNCMVSSQTVTGIAVASSAAGKSAILYAYNDTVYVTAANATNTYGIRAYISTCFAKNCYASADATRSFEADGTGGIITVTTCASSDATGTAGLRNMGVSTGTFVTIASASYPDITDDMHLNAGVDIVDKGTDLSTDAIYPFTTDIDGDTRATWDIGADEYVAPAGGGGFIRKKTTHVYGGFLD